MPPATDFEDKTPNFRVKWAVQHLDRQDQQCETTNSETKTTDIVTKIFKTSTAILQYPSTVPHILKTKKKNIYLLIY